MPTRGHFVVHSRAVPPLGAGDYVLEGTQHVSGGDTEPYGGHLRITSPRYRMPPEQILSTFPPANAEGAYESRLPQIVLKRRTLPWERIVDPDRREIPWLALVVIAEGEGQLSGETPIAECVTSGVTLTGPNDVATGVYLAVSQTVVDRTFPRLADLQLLVHVREVDIDDTELAMGDDDGFLAVVLANRLPQFDRIQCRPVRYLACLINLEGQLDALPTPSPIVVEEFLATAVVQDVRPLAAALALDADRAVMGAGVLPELAMGPGGLSTAGIGTPASATVPKAHHAAAQSPAARSWATTPAQVEAVAVSASASEAGRLVRDAMGAGFRFPIERLLREKIYRFPVLAHWSFTCTGAGSFETLMQGLDVGLLGTLPADPSARPRPECSPPVAGDAPPAPPPTRPDPELAGTGHVGLGHLTRRGDRVRAWYRGPLSPHVTARDQPEPGGRLPLAHTSDQLRRVVPDGREDLSLAAAFEIGRLLALSQPSVVGALMRWRREQFGAERARRLSRSALEGIALLEAALASPLNELGQMMGRRIVVAEAGAPEKVLAPGRPLADPGRPVTYLTGDLEEVIADGFGLPLERVRELAGRLGPAGALRTVAVPLAETPELDASAAGHLRNALTSAVTLLAQDAAPAGVSGPRGATAAGAGRDALDELLEAAAGRRGRGREGEAGS